MYTGCTVHTGNKKLLSIIKISFALSYDAINWYIQLFQFKTMEMPLKKINFINMFV